ncbi:MAG: hypothetical protein JSV25_09005 [Spirochaetota bacterium]|nr:MAG: hypothetical protein JSV25_09005 [Spirochaetota bacterium]
MKRNTIILSLFFVITAQMSIAKEDVVSMDLFYRFSTGLRLGSEEPVDYILNWTIGADLGCGLWYGPLHAGIAGGIKIPALWPLWVIGSSSSSSRDSGAVWHGYIDFPLRCYAGYHVLGREHIQINAFFGRYYRFGIGRMSDAQDFEVGASFSIYDFFFEASYTWPDTNWIQFCLGHHGSIRN